MTRYGIAALLFLASALFHAFALTWPSISVAETPETHLLFVLVNLWFANETITASRSVVAYLRIRFYVALAALTLHQLIVHGWMIVTTPHIDAQSIGVLLGFAVIWGLLNPQASDT